MGNLIRGMMGLALCLGLVACDNKELEEMTRQEAEQKELIRQLTRTREKELAALAEVRTTDPTERITTVKEEIKGLEALIEEEEARLAELTKEEKELAEELKSYRGKYPVRSN